MQRRWALPALPRKSRPSHLPLIRTRLLMKTYLSFSGKVWGPYISADTFKTVFLPTGVPGFWQPVLLDRWGQVIQYFPRYGLANNRTSDSTYAAVDAKVQAGPLYGYSQPASVDGIYGQDAIWDWRDGAAFFATPSPGGMRNPVTGDTDAVIPWPDPTLPAAPFFEPQYTIQWMLGAQVMAGRPHANEITPATSTKLSFDGPFILISAGPDGPERASSNFPERTMGGYCNFLDATGNFNDASGSALTALELQQIFSASGNIYNFDRP